MSAKSILRTFAYWVPVLLVAPALVWGFARPAADRSPVAAVAAVDSGAPERVARGRYLVETIGCGDCHSPKVMGEHGPEEDLSRRLSGHPEDVLLDTPPALGGGWIAATSADLTAWSGPWGISYTFNLTPDENTGIGSWSEDTFVQAIRTGRHMGVSRPILPPMPWQIYRNLTDEDLRSIYAFLRTIPPIHNRVPLPVPPEEMPDASAPTAGR